MVMGGGEVMLKIFFKDREERDRTNADLKKLLSEIKTNRQKYEGTLRACWYTSIKIAASRQVT